MKKNIILFFVISIVTLSCNKSDDNTYGSTNDLVKKIWIRAGDNSEITPEDGYFYNSTFEFTYTKQNKPSSIKETTRHRYSLYNPDTERYEDRLVNLQKEKLFTYDKNTHLLLQEITKIDQSKSIKTFQYNETKQLVSVKEVDKETLFTYNAAGMVERINVNYTDQSNNNNSTQRLTYDGNQNLHTATYETNYSKNTFYFTYSDVESFYKNNPINYTLSELIVDERAYGLDLQKILHYSDFLANFEHIYKGFHLIHSISFDNNLPFLTFNTINYADSFQQIYEKGDQRQNYLYIGYY